MSKIQARLAGFEAQIQVFANEALISKEYLLDLLGIVTQVLDVAQEGMDRSNKRMDWVEQLFEQGIRRTSGLLPQLTCPEFATSSRNAPVLPPHISKMTSVGGIDTDTPLGTVQIRGCDTPLSATLLFQMIRDCKPRLPSCQNAPRTPA